MKSNEIVVDARVSLVRNLKSELAESKKRLAEVEAERDVLLAHFSLGLAALFDFAQLPSEAPFRIIDGWNAILHSRAVSKLTSEDISRLKAEYLAARGIVAPSADTPPSGSCGEVPAMPPLSVWIVFDGTQANSYRSGAYRVTYTGGTGAHRADRMIIDYIHAAKLLGLDVSRITVETVDKAFAKKIADLGARVEAPHPFHDNDSKQS